MFTFIDRVLLIPDFNTKYFTIVYLFNFNNDVDTVIVNYRYTHIHTTGQYPTGKIRDTYLSSFSLKVSSSRKRSSQTQFYFLDWSFIACLHFLFR